MNMTERREKWLQMKCVILCLFIWIMLVIPSYGISPTYEDMKEAKQIHGVEVSKLYKFIYEKVDQYKGNRNSPQRSEEIHKIVVGYLKGWNNHKISPLLLASVGKKESTFNPKAKGKAGEASLQQIHPGWKRSWGKNAGFDPPVGDLWDIDENIRISSLILLRNGIHVHPVKALEIYNSSKHKKSYARIVWKQYLSWSKEFWDRYAEL